MVKPSRQLRDFRLPLITQHSRAILSRTEVRRRIVEDRQLLRRHLRQISRDAGVFAQPVVYPTVALDKARIRTIVSAAHSDEMLDRSLTAFDSVGRELGLTTG